MPSLFVIELPVHYSFHFKHLHRFDNGYMLCYDEWDMCYKAKMCLDSEKYFCEAFWCRCCLSSHLVSEVKKKKLLPNSVCDEPYHSIPKFVWAKLKSTPVLWPVEVKEIRDQESLVYVNSDQAFLTVKLKDIVPFCENTQRIEQECLGKLKKKKLLQNIEAFKKDMEWVRANSATSTSRVSKGEDGSPQDSDNESQIFPSRPEATPEDGCTESLMVRTRPDGSSPDPHPDIQTVASCQEGSPPVASCQEGSPPVASCQEGSPPDPHQDNQTVKGCREEDSDDGHWMLYQCQEDIFSEDPDTVVLKAFRCPVSSSARPQYGSPLSVDVDNCMLSSDEGSCSSAGCIGSPIDCSNQDGSKQNSNTDGLFVSTIQKGSSQSAHTGSLGGTPSDSDSDYIECSDLEEYTDVGGDDNDIPEKYKERDVNIPEIYIRKYRKSQNCSAAQAKRKTGTRVYDNYHACYFCGELVQHLNVHIQGKKHMKIPEVKKFLEENPDFAKIRKSGDHKHNVKVLKNGCGEIILGRRPTVLDISLFGPCPECKEWILLKNMKAHFRNCAKSKPQVSKGTLIIQSQVMAGMISSNPSKLMLEEVFPNMLQDDISNTAKKDKLIVALGESWLRRCIDNREKRRYYTSQHMRLMARLLINLRKEDAEGSDKSLNEYICTQKFDAIVAAALSCCLPYMDDVDDLQSPSNAIKLKYDIRRVVSAKWALLVKEDPHSLEAKEMQTCLELIRLEWGERLTKLARATLVRRSFRLKKELPTPEDVMKLSTHLVNELKTIDLVPENYKRIVQLTQTRLLLYNKRRSGEIDVISLESFAGKTKDLDDVDQSLVGELTDIEKHLLKTQEMMTVRGKGHRPVPVLIPEDAQRPLEYLASWFARKAAGISRDNCYLFANTGTVKYTRAYDSLKETCRECALSAPGRINSISMRKYTATLAQVMNLNSYQIEWLCRHLGHSTNVHKSYYRHMSGFVERVKLSKLFLVQDMNLMSQYKDKNLDDIDLQDLIFPGGQEASLESDPVMDEDETDTNNIDDVVFDDAAEENEWEREDLPDEEEEEVVVDKKKNKRQKAKTKRTQWDDEEHEELNRYFKSYLDTKTCPRKKAIELAKKQSKNRNGKIWKRTNDKIVKKISAINHKK